MDRLTLAQAQRIIAAALEHSAASGYKPMAVVVLDDSGSLKAASREDGATMFRVDIASAKAWAAVSMSASSRALMTRAKENPTFLTSLAAVAQGKFVAQTGAVLIKNARRRDPRRRRRERRHRRRGRGDLHRRHRRRRAGPWLRQRPAAGRVPLLRPRRPFARRSARLSRLSRQQGAGAVAVDGAGARVPSQRHDRRQALPHRQRQGVDDRAAARRPAGDGPGAPGDLADARAALLLDGRGRRAAAAALPQRDHRGDGRRIRRRADRPGRGAAAGHRPGDRRAAPAHGAARIRRRRDRQQRQRHADRRSCRSIRSSRRASRSAPRSSSMRSSRREWIGWSARRRCSRCSPIRPTSAWPPRRRSPAT